ncbi:hypothetical protein VNO78_12160 [Psophocarpus tetragonolobus]|uniref:Uncharacterized protein n=1 Tax=Psophocarpus tetragonolobus TaxID=3891 RepID=A0AAN9XPL4_PSOTE
MQVTIAARKRKVLTSMGVPTKVLLRNMSAYAVLFHSLVCLWMNNDKIDLEAVRPFDCQMSIALEVSALDELVGPGEVDDELEDEFERSEETTKALIDQMHAPFYDEKFSKNELAPMAGEISSLLRKDQTIYFC